MTTNRQSKIWYAANSGFALWGLTYFVETFVQVSTFVLRMNGSAKNPPQRKAANRYVPFLNDNANRYRQTNEFT